MKSSVVSLVPWVVALSNPMSWSSPGCGAGTVEGHGEGAVEVSPASSASAAPASTGCLPPHCGAR